MHGLKDYSEDETAAQQALEVKGILPFQFLRTRADKEEFAAIQQGVKLAATMDYPSKHTGLGRTLQKI